MTLRGKSKPESRTPGCRPFIQQDHLRDTELAESLSRDIFESQLRDDTTTNDGSSSWTDLASSLRSFASG